jgi:FkbM family methyltransferase
MKIGHFEDMIRRTVNRWGVDVHRFRKEATPAGRLTRMLAQHRVDVVLDVGANVGQFARALRAAGYPGDIVSFEPLTSAHEQLCKASSRDARWKIAPRVALGDHEGEIEMNIAGNSVSSSPLPMLSLHAQAAPESEIVGSERTPVARLDTAASAFLQTATVPFLKIDTQGYEDRVLDGAADLLGRLAGLQLEMSFVPLYEGQSLFDPLLARVNKLGFSIWAIWPGFCDPQSGRMLQVDVVFFRSS